MPEGSRRSIVTVARVRVPADLVGGVDSRSIAEQAPPGPHDQRRLADPVRCNDECRARAELEVEVLVSAPVAQLQSSDHRPRQPFDAGLDLVRIDASVEETL